jgi:hypothetical protein
MRAGGKIGENFHVYGTIERTITSLTKDSHVHVQKIVNILFTKPAYK